MWTYPVQNKLIVDFRSDGREGDTAVIGNVTKVPLLREGENTTLRPSLNCFLVVDLVAKGK